MTRVGKFLALPLGQQVLLLKCWCMLNTTAIALRLLPLPVLLRIFGTNGRVPNTSGSSSPDRTGQILWSIRAAAALSWKPTCAARGLVAERLLRRAGVAVEFRLGVARRNDDFQAHAWVASKDGILVGASEAEYQPLPDLVSAGISRT